MFPRAVFVAVLFGASAGCATYSSELVRAQRAYEAGEDERALAIARALEPDTDHLEAPDRARYAYLRGMTDYRLGYKADARHWLAVAAADEKEVPGSLPADWTATLDESLADLSAAVYSNGIASLTDTAVAVGPSRTVVQAADESSGIFDGGAPPRSP
jgi:hypothetical protein